MPSLMRAILFKRKVIGRELPSVFPAKGRIPVEFLKFAIVSCQHLPGIFPSFDGVGACPMRFQEQCTKNVFGVMS